MNPSAMPWWAWLLAAALCWYIQLVLSIRTDKGGTGAWTVRVLFIVIMFLTAVIGLIRFVKWVSG
jgi:hypothetical protein